jgi:acetate kinase
MKILIANPGSTSYKCKLYDLADMEILFQANVERIGDNEGIYSFNFSGEEQKINYLKIPDYFFAVNLTLESIKKRILIGEISAVGFKTVHAKDVTGCVELTDEVLDAMEAYRLLAPVHTDVYLKAISVFKEILKDTSLIGLFETDFHKNIPPEAYLYGIPYEYYEKHGVRKYGFHGASHRYIGLRAKELFHAEKIISCHLGGSSSVCAINNGVSIDTSMGMSPQSGLLQAKRVGDLDSFALLYLMEKENLSINEIQNILMSKGGIWGISGISGDFRDIEKGMLKGNKRAELAFKTFAYYVKRYIGEYLAILNSPDCIVFTAGAGQNSALLRKEILSNMDNLGIIIDEDKNNSNPKEGLISQESSKIKIAIIPTNEEYIVANEVKNFLENKKLKE